jgi:hypothetical protein
MRREKTQVCKIRNEKREITTNSMEIQGIMTYNFKNLYSNKLEVMDKFHDTYEHPNLNNEDINHLNRSIICNEIEVAIKSLPQKISPGSHGFSAEFYQNFKEELIPTVLKIFHEIEKEGTLPKLFYEANTTLLPKPEKDISKRNMYRSFSLMNNCAKTHKIIEN